jgi:hypothetical protein
MVQLLNFAGCVTRFPFDMVGDIHCGTNSPSSPLMIDRKSSQDFEPTTNRPTCQKLRTTRKLNMP